MLPSPGASLGRVAAIRPLPSHPPSQDTVVPTHLPRPPGFLPPALLSGAQKMTLPLSLFLSLSPASSPLCPSLLSPPRHPPRVDQTQTQLEHARIGELEQNLLLEKAQAERLLRELADNRVIPPPPAARRRLACPRPLQLLWFIIFSVSGCSPHCFVFFLLLCPF